MESLLYLVHRIPYPPNKGDKIRSFHLLQFLSRYFDVYLGAFVDDPRDWAHESLLRQYCKDVQLRPLVPRWSKLRSLSGLLTRQALTLPYYFDSGLQRWVDNTIEKVNIRRCVVFSSAMTQYLMADRHKTLLRIADFVDVDSDKWRQYSGSHHFPLSWLYSREAKLLAAFERRVAKQYDAVLFVSEDELNVFVQRVMTETKKSRAASPELIPRSAASSRKDTDFSRDPARSQSNGRRRLDQQSPESTNRAELDYFHNGVDIEYFNPAENLKDPYPADKIIMVFTGAMDYWANADAVIWFAQGVLPIIREQVPSAVFFIVGANPTEEVRALQQQPGVVVTGAVEDIRPYLHYACFAVAPLRIARGVQNKVLEAMAMEKPVIATPAAIEGIAKCDVYQPLVVEGVGAFAQACIDLLRSGSRNLRLLEARQCIKRHYDWHTNLQRLVSHLDLYDKQSTPTAGRD